MHYSGTAYEDVEVEIEVQTNPFDNSINNCNRQISRLTDSVVAMEAAQIASINENARRVSDTIIDGFFQSVKSDISTQKMMLEQTIDSRLMLLHQQHKTLMEKKAQMQKDYERTSARYEKIFTDLNNELASRIHKLEQPVFDLVKQVEQDQSRMLGSDMIHIAVTHNKDAGNAHAQLNLAKVKADSRTTMSKIHKFLEDKAVSDATVRKAIIPDTTGKDTYLVPVCYMATESANGRNDSKCEVAQLYVDKHADLPQRLKEKLQKEEFPKNSEQEVNQIKSFVQAEISRNIDGSDAHSVRVRDMINTLLSKNL